MSICPTRRLGTAAMPLPTYALLETLGGLGLLSAQQIEVVGQLAATMPEAQRLAEELVRRGWITRYQASELLRGQGDGLVVGPYLKLQPLSKGGMGQVFRARHRFMERVVALKLILSQCLHNHAAVERFL